MPHYQQEGHLSTCELLKLILYKYAFGLGRREPAPNGGNKGPNYTTLPHTHTERSLTTSTLGTSLTGTPATDGQGRSERGC